MKVIWWHNKRTERWIRKHCYFEDWQLMANGIACDWRCADDIAEGLTDADFTPGKDFSVS